MRNLAFLTTTLWLLFALHCAVAENDSDERYIFASPRSLKTGVENELVLTRTEASEEGNLKVTIIATDSYSGNETVMQEQDFTLEKGVKHSVLPLFLPASDVYIYSGKISINGSSGDCRMEGSDDVNFSTGKKSICLIQTDKPMYKPGQDVMCRIMNMDKDFKAIPGSEAEVYVEDPQSMRLFQWKPVPLGSGIKQLEFPLSDQTTQGTWKIFASIEGELCSTTFEVKEYVLPKFEVKIGIPSYVLSDADTIPIEINAIYTYGKPVKGTLTLSVSLEKYAWSTEKTPVIEYSGEINGAYPFVINVSMIESENFYRYRRIEIVASVKEAGTGIERNETKYIQRTFSPLQLTFNQDMKQYFKPGLPFNGELKVTYPDSTPAEGEDIEICAEGARERNMFKGTWLAHRKVEVCRNFTSGPDGGIKFTLPPQNTDTISIQLKAKSLKYGRNHRSNDRQSSLSQPQTSMSLNPWYSPSGSFIQLQLEDDVLECGSKTKLKLLFTSKEDAEFDFKYQVIYQGKVLQSGSVQKSFSVQDDVSSQYQDQEKLVNARETQISPPPQSSDSSLDGSSDSSEDQCASIREAKYVPPIGEAFIDVDVDASLSPTFFVLVYYVRSDKETIADSQKLKVQKCLKNEVDFEFGDEAKQPGTKTSIKVKASPHSLCGIKVVDKSVSLLDSSEQVTKEKVFSLVESMDNGMYYSINHCNKKVPQPGLYKSSSSMMIQRPRPYSTSSYEDGITAFENCGFLIISNLRLFTRLCKNNKGGGQVYDAQMESTFAGNGAHAVALQSARRPAAPVAVHQKVGVEATKSVVDVRNYFPDTWLFKMVLTDSEGTFAEKEKLPHTITEWKGNAICINTKYGLGISDTATIKGFQAFFLSFTLPYSVIRGETFTVTVKVFSYVKDSLPITVTMEQPDGSEIVGGPVHRDICIEPESSYDLQFQLKARQLGLLNITVRGETTQSNDACGSSSVADAMAKDAITEKVLVKAEGWAIEDSQSILAKPKDEENSIFSKTFSQKLPEDYVPDSATSRIDVCGNIMGPTLHNLENLMTIPTGCGEQNMVKFVPNMVVLEFLKATNQLTKPLKERAIKNLHTGAQRQMQYSREDGSQSAFGSRDKEGSMFLTAFVLRSFASAQRHISIDNDTLTRMQEWIVSKQKPDGCVPNVGKIIDHDLLGGIEKENTGTITAYCLASLLLSGYTNTTVIDAAVSCMNQNPKEKLSAYDLFVYAYALNLAGESKSAEEHIDFAIEKYSNKTVGGTLHFNIVNGTKSQILETTGYAVLAMLETGYNVQKALPIVQFMTRNMNSKGGYSSTQDTCVVIQALGKFAMSTNSEPVVIDVTISGPMDKTIKITEDNKLVVHRYEINNLEQSAVKVKAEGDGYVLIQFVSNFNVYNPPEKRKFNIEATGECKDDECKLATITTRVRFIPEGLEAGMSIIRMKMVSGMMPEKQSLEALQLNGKDLGIMRCDVEKDVLVIYFDKIGNKEIKFDVEVQKITEVKDQAKGQVDVQDYYNRENAASSSYALDACNSESASCSKED